MKRFTTAVLLCLGVFSCVAAPARAGMRLDAWRGHIAVGFAHAFSDSLAPAGSMSVAAGVDYPLGQTWRVGPELSFNLLGSSTVQRGSIVAGLDYSVFETALMFTHLNAHTAINRWSIGPGIASPRADLSVSAGGAGFSDLAIGDTRPELAADVCFMPRRMKIVAVGAELGARVIPVPHKATWTLLTARLAIHF